MLRAVHILILILSLPALVYPMSVSDSDANLSSHLLHARLETSLLSIDRPDDNTENQDFLLRTFALEDVSRPRFEARSGYDATGKKKYLPVLFSLLVPGAGEIYMGYYKRGAVLVALEATAWIGYANYHSKGLDTREAYEAYADEHWSFDDFLLYHHSGPYASLDELEEAGKSGIWEQSLDAPKYDALFYMPFVSKKEDKQHYYENAGKYDWFLAGWDDWSRVVNGQYTDYTENRTAYKTMRAESNDQLTRANQFVYLSIAARAFSLFETIILTRRAGKSEDSSSNGFNFKAKPEGWHGAKFVLEYNFK